MKGEIKMSSVKYKNYKVDGHIFTIRFTRYRSIKKPIYFEIMSVHEHPATFRQRVREFFKTTTYKVGWWDCLNSRYPTMEDRLVVELKDLVYENKRIFDFEHWWWN